MSRIRHSVRYYKDLSSGRRVGNVVAADHPTCDRANERQAVQVDLASQIKNGKVSPRKCRYDRCGASDAAFRSGNETTKIVAMPYFDDDGNELGLASAPILAICLLCQKNVIPMRRSRAVATRSIRGTRTQFRCDAFVRLYGPLIDGIIE